MKTVIDPGKKRKSLTLLDNVCFSTVQNEDGEEQKLYMSLMFQNGNIEKRLANCQKLDGNSNDDKKPVILWVPGGGYRGCDKNLMVPEMTYLAEAGYVVASIYYRSSGEAKFPAQIIDVKTAIRFLKSNAEKYNINPNKIGTMGRSAGGHLAALAGLNLPGYDTEEWSTVNSEVEAVCDLFGPVDVPYCLEMEKIAIETKPNNRWKTIEETHPGALMGGDVNTMSQRAVIASPPYLIQKSKKVAPMLIMHGDCDHHVPSKISENFYNKLVEAGYEKQSFYYLIKGGDHGSDEFFQPQVQQIIVDFFDQFLKDSENKGE